MNQISPWPRPGNCKEIIEYSEVPFPVTGSLLIDDNENIRVVHLPKFVRFSNFKQF